MANKLKATGAGNLFVVFGEPDIEIKELPDDMPQVEIRGMDISIRPPGRSVHPAARNC
jgi:adenine-specific DNA-methyltransferase